MFSTIRNLPQWVLFHGTHPLYSYYYFLRPVVHVFTKRHSPASKMIFFQESKDQILISNHFFFSIQVFSHQAISCPIVAQTALSLSGSPTYPHFFNIQLCRCQERISFLFLSVLIGTIKFKIKDSGAGPNNLCQMISCFPSTHNKRTKLFMVDAIKYQRKSLCGSIEKCAACLWPAHSLTRPRTCFR